MQGILHEEASVSLFLFVTCFLGGWAAWMTGRAMASTWRSYPVLIAYLMLLGLAVRFIHFSLFGGTLLSIHYYLVDTVVLQVIGAMGYRMTRVAQMTAKYRWLYLPHGPFAWRDRS
jgi:small-conductance mechanosensitive channel